MELRCGTSGDLHPTFASYGRETCESLASQHGHKRKRMLVIGLQDEDISAVP